MPPATELAAKRHTHRVTEETSKGSTTVRGWMALAVICAVVAVIFSLSA